MGRYAASMVDWRGELWDFTADWVAGIKSGGIDGLTGSLSDVAVTPLGVGGQVVVSQEPAPIQGSLTFHCRGEGDRDAGQVYADLRRAFSPLRGRESTLRVVSPTGEADLRVRRGGAMSDPVEDPSWSDMVLSVQVPVVADEGVWWLPPVVLFGEAPVVNSGDVPVFVTVGWSGAGGQVTMPSGATFTLPPVQETRYLHLSRRRSLSVTDGGGVRDDVLWRQLRGLAPEVVPVGAQRTFRVPDGAWVEYRLGVLDPWQ